MRAYVATGIMGTFAFDAKGGLIEKRLFPKKAEEIARKLEKATLIPEEEDLLRALVARGYKEAVLAKKAAFPGLSLLFQDDHLGIRKLQEEFRSLAISLKWVTSQAELNELLSAVSGLRTAGQLRQQSRDRIILHTIGMFDELERGLNTLSERLREWYGLHFPELARELRDHEAFAAAIAKAGARDRIPEVADLGKTSAGMDFTDADLKEVQSIAAAVADLYQRKTSLAIYLENLCQELIPNISAVAGKLLGARLLAQAGGLERFSRMPSSTVQVLGAEKALFRHLKGEGKSPKFGLLFAHPLVQQAAPEHKGKAARLIAAKLTLAARMDFFSKENHGAELRKALDEQAKQLQIGTASTGQGS
ncbi:MAG: hypothetical protein HY369_05655 [Candidatus Aenigmarchaeota archaeon]|nr:hypothetical protein [Candidatus Aenigmarchaeota archaeon]